MWYCDSLCVLFFKQKSAYEVRISDWSSDVCSSDLIRPLPPFAGPATLLYSGNLGRKQGLGQVVALAETLQQSRPDITVLVRGAGSGRAGLLAEARAKGLSNLQEIGSAHV